MIRAGASPNLEGMRDDFLRRLSLADLERLCRLYSNPAHAQFGSEQHRLIRVARNQRELEEAQENPSSLR